MNKLHMNKTMCMHHYYALSFIILFVHCERFHSFSVLEAVSNILISLLPAVVLVFSVKCAKCKTKKVGDILENLALSQYTLILVKTGILN